MRHDLPFGTVTFCFTDVEGSTRLLHELGAEAYADALAEHRRVIREACALEGGVEVDTQGDAFFFAFASAPGAAAAAASFTQELRAGPIQVRVGLHTGSPLLGAEGYVGDDVHFAARVAATSHGGQIICSQATAELIAPSDTVSQGVLLVALGSHRLKDIADPVSIYQLGDGSFPPLKTIANSNLPTPASSFLGREDELYDADALLRSTRLLTIAGPGGQGKTRFALELATRAREERFSDYPDGVFASFVASLRDPSLVLATIAQPLNVKEQPGQSALDALSSHLQAKKMLLLLDNAEHLLDAAPELSQLLQAVNGLTLLVTSRELLRIQGETPYSLPPLQEDEGIALFCERARLEPSPEIAELCSRLEGLPLAIELAAARTAILTPAQLLERLSQRLDLLKGTRDADPRQQTLRATIEWSYDLLSPDEQRLFRSLSVFAGGCTLEAAEEVAGADLDSLQGLVDKSLLRFSDERFWMLETISEYAWESLEEAGGIDAAMDEHAEWLVRLVVEVGATRAIDADVRVRFAAELDNFRAALSWSELHSHVHVQRSLIGGSWLYWWDRGHAVEGLRWVESALRQSEGDRTKEAANVLAAGAMFAARAGDQQRLRAYAEASLSIACERADAAGQIWPLIFLGIWAGQNGSYHESERHYETAIAIAGETGYRELVAVALNNLGVNAAQQGDFERATRFYADARVISRERGALEDLAMETLNLAEGLCQLSQLDAAVEAAREGLALARGLESERGMLQGLGVVVSVQCLRGDRGWSVAQLVGAIEVLRERLGEAPEPDAHLGPIVDELEEIMGADEYTAALSQGRTMPTDAAVDIALASLD